MNTEHLILENSHELAIRRITEILRQGGVVLHPTDTIYGLAVDATNPHAVEKVRSIKQRNVKKPFLVLVSDMDMLLGCAVVTDLAKELLEEFSTDPITLVLSRKGNALEAVHAGDGSLGFRIPTNKLCRDIVSSLGKAIVSTSANISGTACFCDVASMVTFFEGKVDLIVTREESHDVGKPSTIIDARGESPNVLREGTITSAMVDELLYYKIKTPGP